MRSDGIRVIHDDPMYHLMPYFLTKRYDAMNMITLDIPEAPLRGVRDGFDVVALPHVDGRQIAGHGHD